MNNTLDTNNPNYAHLANILASEKIRYVVNYVGKEHHGEQFARIDLVCGGLVLAMFRICDAKYHTHITNEFDNPLYTTFVSSPVGLPESVFRHITKNDISKELFDWLLEQND